MSNLQLFDASSCGFSPETLADMRLIIRSKVKEIKTIETDLQKFVDGLSVVERDRLLDSSSHCGKYITDWMEAFSPLFADLETLIKELRGKKTIYCTIDKLRYPVWNPKWKIPGCIPHCWKNV